MNMKRALGAISATALAALWSVPAAAAWTLNLREGVTELSREIYGLHMLILWICVVIAVAVFSVMIYSIATFRKSKGAVPATFEHNTKAEIIWTVIPVMILGLLGARLYHGISDARFRQIVLGMLTLSGVAMLVASLPRVLGSWG